MKDETTSELKTSASAKKQALGLISKMEEVPSEKQKQATRASEMTAPDRDLDKLYKYANYLNRIL